MSIVYYDRQGLAISREAFVASFEHPDAKRVAETQIGESWVSTVWLGIDHGFGEGPPIIFETLVFNGPLADEMERYTTEADALAGHEAMCARVRAA